MGSSTSTTISKNAVVQNEKGVRMDSGSSDLDLALLIQHCATQSRSLGLCKGNPTSLGEYVSLKI
jgi:hypothetical protein